GSGARSVGYAGGGSRMERRAAAAAMRGGDGLRRAPSPRARGGGASGDVLWDGGGGSCCGQLDRAWGGIRGGHAEGHFGAFHRGLLFRNRMNSSSKQRDSNS